MPARGVLELRGIEVITIISVVTHLVVFQMEGVVTLLWQPSRSATTEKIQLKRNKLYIKKQPRDFAFREKPAKSDRCR